MNSRNRLQIKNRLSKAVAARGTWTAELKQCSEAQKWWEGPVSGHNGFIHRSKQHPYSITPSARASSLDQSRCLRCGDASEAGLPMFWMINE
jgi:hypothetical protein